MRLVTHEHGVRLLLLASLVVVGALGACGETDVGAKAEEPPRDASDEDDAPRAEGGLPDVTLSTFDDLLVCDTAIPADMSLFEPTFKKPAALHAGLCTAAQVDALACLFEPVTSAGCMAAAQEKGNEDCFKCLFTDKGNKELGPIVVDGSIFSLNTAGCIADATGDFTSSGCGAKVQAADQCIQAACNRNMPIAEECGAERYQRACYERAVTSVCKKLVDAALCTEALIGDAGTLDACKLEGDFAARGKQLGMLFCGPPTSDASVEGG